MIKRGPSFPATIVGRMEAIEKRLNGKLQALKTVRPVLEAFYATLGEQKANLAGRRGTGRFWHWLDRWQAVSLGC